MRRFLGSRAGNALKPASSFDELEALEDALASASLVMDDQVEEAERRLSQGTSPFHKLGVAMAFFLRATLGFEKDVIETAKAKLNEAGQAAQEYRRSALRDPSNAHQSGIYPAGSEYALCHAESQLMGAVLAVLNESLTESLKGFYNLRKAYNTLYEISEAEKRFMESHRKTGKTDEPELRSSHTSTSTAGSKPETLPNVTDSATATMITEVDGDGEDERFEDVHEHPTESIVPNNYQGHLEYSDGSVEVPNHDFTAHAQPPNPIASEQPGEATVQGEIESYTSNPVDLFVHAGTNLCYGLLQLIVSMIPPAFSRILNLFNFRGDRHKGLRRLWIATKYKEDINGAMAALVILGYHNTILDACDILPADAMPRTRLRTLLGDMRRLYPNSKLWMMEEARILGGERQLEAALDVLRGGRPSTLRQINAMTKFDMALDLLYLQEYQQCADAFMDCIDLNDWSHALYYYIAGACNVELYRLNKTADEGKAEKYARQAEKHFREVPAHMTRKRLMGRQLPINDFVSRKISKWESRASVQSCRLVDAVGVSPAAEMIYFWSGFRKMGVRQLDTCLERLGWSSNLATNPKWTEEAIDEKCIASFLKAVCQRFSGDVKSAKSTLTDEVLVHDLQDLKACRHADAWTLPIAHYELAVCLWCDTDEDGLQDTSLAKCSQELSRIENWETFELEARVGMKVATARQSLQQRGFTSTR